jgi:hypothetical protein
MGVKSNHPYKVLVWVAVGLLALALGLFQSVVR